MSLGIGFRLYRCRNIRLAMRTSQSLGLGSERWRIQNNYIRLRRRYWSRMIRRRRHKTRWWCRLLVHFLNLDRNHSEKPREIERVVRRKVRSVE